MKDLDLFLKEAQNRWIRVQRARQSVPTNNGEFAARVAALKARIDALQGRMAAVQRKQADYLAQVAVAELEQQKNRLATYQVQARFASATMYDRAANPEPAKKPEDVAPTQKGDEPQSGAAPLGPVEQPQSDSAAPARSTQQVPPPSPAGPQPSPLHAEPPPASEPKP